MKLSFLKKFLLIVGLSVASVPAWAQSMSDSQVMEYIKKEAERGTSQQQIVTMPFAVELKDFIMETYDDGLPKRFASNIQVLTKSGKDIQTTIEVNKPIEVDGWKIYQYGYDTQMGAMSQYSILELVSDPWLPFVYTGIYMMLGGAVCMFLKGKKVKG